MININNCPFPSSSVCSEGYDNGFLVWKAYDENKIKWSKNQLKVVVVAPGDFQYLLEVFM